MPSVKIEVRDQEVTAALSRVIALGEDPSPVLDALGRQVKTNVQLGFVAGTDPYGRPWAPLKLRSGQPLRDKGHLMNSIDYQAEGNSVVIGTNMSYAPTHQFGATIEAKPGKRLVFMGPGNALIFAKKVTIPARPMFPTEGLPPQWRDDLTGVIGDMMRRAWRG